MSQHDAVPAAGLDAAPAAGLDAPNGVTVAERRDLIVDLVERVPQVSVGDLASRFGVTDVSIRRDLTTLEEQGRLRRIHGGAVAATRRQARDAFALRERFAHDEKRRIVSRPHRWSARATWWCSTRARPWPRSPSTSGARRSGRAP